jgi:geranyl-CoA carboxylase beta subunit
VIRTADERRTADKSAASRARFEQRGQLLPRERLALLLDPGTPGWNCVRWPASGWTARPGQERARRRRDGRHRLRVGVRCMVAVRFGHRRRCHAGHGPGQGMLRVQELALENKLPFVQLVESAGANLLKYRVEGFVRGGSLFRNLARHVGRRAAGGHRHARLVHRRRRLPDRAVATTSSWCAAVRGPSWPARRC